MELNERKIRLSGIACIPHELTLSKTYDLTISDAEITRSQEVPTEDGKIDKIYTVKITESSQVNLIGEGEVIQSKKKGSQSQKLRNVLYAYWTQNSALEYPDFEPFYTKQMSRFIDSVKSKL